MDVKNAAYWGTTALFSLALGGGGLGHLSGAMAEAMAHLGYPAYFSTIIGTWKVLGVVALLAPGFPRLKEWAYAGFTVLLTGAAASHAASGDGAVEVIVPLVLLGVMAASWALRPASRVLGTLPGVNAASRPVPA